MNDSAPVFDFSSFPTLTTEPLVLRELQPSDADDVFVFRSDPEVQRYNSEPFREVSQARAFIEELRADYAAQKILMWGVTLQGPNAVLGLV